MATLKWWLIIFQFLQLVTGQGSHENDEMTKASKYLNRFGYLEYPRVSASKLEHALKRFQSFANLKVTGKLDKATRKKMNAPRCGNTDPEEFTRRKRYIHQGTRWRKQLLTWRLDGHSRFLRSDTIRRTLMAAMYVWSSEINIDFKESTKKNADIIIKFEQGNHGGPFPFDGPGGIFAHAFYPHHNYGLSGDIRFDDDDKFTVDKNAKNGLDLMWVATHELGHSLGLEHSPIENAIMYPWYKAPKGNVRLSDDDVYGVQTLYGSRTKPLPTLPTLFTPPTKTKPPTKTAPPPPTTTTPTKTPTKIPCPRSSTTAIWSSSKSHLTYFLTEKQDLYSVSKNGKKKFGPIPAKSYFGENHMRHIDAAIGPVMFDPQRSDKNIGQKSYSVFFSGTSYYIYSGFQYIAGPISIHSYSLPLRLKLPRWERKIDAAFMSHDKRRMYLFSGLHYFELEVGRFHWMYAKRIDTRWHGVKGPVTAAINQGGQIYLLTGNTVYRFKDSASHVEKGYPRQFGSDLFYCKN